MPNKREFDDHVRGKHHKKQEKGFDAFAQNCLRSVINEVLREFHEAGIYVRTLLAAKIATKSHAQWLTPVKKFLLQRITTIVHSDKPLHFGF